MTVRDFVEIINQTAFPIFVSCALGFYIYKIEGKQTEVLTKLSEAVNKLLEKLKEDK